uniref:Uncharacterized protein n=1 Tax=Anguilla anguilla TaxID=7936 RepID=A0A0E9UJU1_ANGAN
MLICLGSLLPHRPL